MIDFAPGMRTIIRDEEWMIKKIETNLNIFIYNHDLDILVKNPRAFDSFLLALAGQNVLQKKNLKLPDWTEPDLGILHVGADAGVVAFVDHGCHVRIRRDRGV